MTKQKPLVFNLSMLNSSELASLRSQIDTELDTREGKMAVVADLLQILAEKGLTVVDLQNLTTPEKPVKAKKPVPAKYIDPQNPDNKWSGRGRTPRWVAAAMSQGHSWADLAVAA